MFFFRGGKENEKNDAKMTQWRTSCTVLCRLKKTDQDTRRGSNYERGNDSAQERMKNPLTYFVGSDFAWLFVMYIDG